MSVVPDLDPFRPANGFAEPPASSAYTQEFLARSAFKDGGNALDRRRSLAPKIITVFRTDADPRTAGFVRGLYFGGPIAQGKPAGNELAAAEIITWPAVIRAAWRIGEGAGIIEVCGNCRRGP